MSLTPLAPLYLGGSRRARPLPRGLTGHVAYPSRSILAGEAEAVCYIRRLTQSPLQLCGLDTLPGNSLRLMCQIAGPVYLALVLLWSLRRGFVSRLDCVLFGHVFALLRRAVKTRAFPVVNMRLRVNPHETVAPAQCGWVGRYLARARCGNWTCGRTRFCLSFCFFASGFLFGRSRWRLAG